MAKRRGNKTGRRNTRAIKPSVKQRAFLAAVAQCGNITKAAELSKCARQKHYEWLKEHEWYPPAFDDAMEEACQRLEAEAVRRAYEGVDEPVFQKGMQVGVIRRYSDRLLEFLLKARRPEMYRERQQIDHSSTDGSMAVGDLFDRVASFKRQSLVESNHEGNGNVK